MVSRIKSRERRKTTARWGGAFVAVTLVVVVGLSFHGRWQKPAADDFGGIACSEVERLLPDYIAKRLDPAVSKQIAIHLRECHHCDEIYQRLLKESQTAHANRRDAGAFEILNTAFRRSRPIHPI
jgi:hypothetical protein